MNEEPDFWVPYAGGQLPMIIISMDVTVDGGPFELQSVEMTIRAVSCGAPVMPEDDQTQRRQLP
jgi:hypothetical protein